MNVFCEYVQEKCKRFQIFSFTVNYTSETCKKIWQFLSQKRLSGLVFFEEKIILELS